MNSGSSALDLAERLRQGDEQALEEILRTAGPGVLRLLSQTYRGVLSQADLEDVLAVALYRLWNSRDRYDAAKSSLRVWFFRIAQNVARDVLRYGWQKARQLEVHVEEAYLAQQAKPVVTGDVSNGEAASLNETDTERLRALNAILEQLPEKQRVIVLADAQSPEGVASSAALSAELGIPPGTVRVYRKRALDTIREGLSHYEADRLQNGQGGFQ